MNIKEIPIIDTHQHLWDLSKFKLPWLEDDSVSSINRSFLMEDYLNATTELNVEKTVYMEVNVDPSQQIQEAEYVLDLCDREENPMAAAVLGCSPQSEGFGPVAERFAENPYVKGFRTVLHDTDRPPQLCLQPQFVQNMKLLGELGLHFELCMRPAEISDAVRLADQCPETMFIVDHCGGMGVQSTDTVLFEIWMDAMNQMAQSENTACKISGIVASASEDWETADLDPIVQICLDAFGDDRVFFGGDWPVCLLRAEIGQWIDALGWMVREKPEASVRKLFHDNAAKFYRLS